MKNTVLFALVLGTALNTANWAKASVDDEFNQAQQKNADQGAQQAQKYVGQLQAAIRKKINSAPAQVAALLGTSIAKLGTITYGDDIDSTATIKAQLKNGSICEFDLSEQETRNGLDSDRWNDSSEIAAALPSIRTLCASLKNEVDTLASDVASQGNPLGIGAASERDIEGQASIVSGLCDLTKYDVEIACYSSSGKSIDTPLLEGVANESQLQIFKTSN